MEKISFLSQSVIKNNDPIKIFENIFLRKNLSIIGNSDFGVFYKIPDFQGLQEEEELQPILIPASVIIKIKSSNKKDENFIFETSSKGDKITIYSGNTKFQSPSFSSDGYPIPHIEKSPSIIVSGELFLTALQAAEQISLSNHFKPFLNGVHLFSKEQTFLVEATDGGRAFRFNFLETDFLGESIIDAILPKKTAQALIKIINKESPEKIKIYQYKSKIIFYFNNITFWANTIEGNFPKEFLDKKLQENKEARHFFTLLVDEFLDCMSKMVFFDENKHVCSISIQENTATVSTENSSGFSVDSQLSVINQSNPPLLMHYRIEFLEQMIKFYKNTNNLKDEVTFYYAENNPKSALMIFDESKRFQFLIMPIIK